ncbi:MAG: hypothetical protein H6559_27810 [Lewinellaceae bacterium]|nr:hypothetical protein [Lewinellaceae bacterium]
MGTNYSMEDIVASLQGEKTEEDTRQFWQAANSDNRLLVEIEACCLLVRVGRASRFRRFLKEIEDFDKEFSGAGPE